MTEKVKRNIYIGLTCFGMILPLSIVLPVVLHKADKSTPRIKQEYSNIIQDFHIENIESKTGVSDNVIHILNKKLSTRMPYGPEVFNLKKISIVGEDPTKNNNEAFTETGADEIIFVTKKLNELKLNFDEDKAEYMYELIFHEYAHYIADTYLTNIVDTKKITADIYKDGNIIPWSKSYIDKFKKLLKYDVDTKKYNSTPIKNNIVSIGSIYNQKDLFEKSNGKNKPTYNKLKDKELNNINAAMSPLNPDPVRPLGNVVFPTIKHTNFHIESKDLKYLYLMEELFARKYQLIMMQYKPTVNLDNNSFEGFNKNGWINLKHKDQFWSPYLQDILNFKRDLNSENGEYLHDNPFNKKKEMNDLFGIQFKQKDISLISFVNHSSLENGILKTSVDEKRINIGGYLPSNSSYTYIGYEDDGKPAKFHWFPLNIKTINGKKFYQTKWNKNLLIKEMVNKVLYFAESDKGKSATKMKSLYNEYDHEVSTNRGFAKHVKDYKAVINKSGFVEIKEII